MRCGQLPLDLRSIGSRVVHRLVARTRSTSVQVCRQRCDSCRRHRIDGEVHRHGITLAGCRVGYNLQRVIARRQHADIQVCCVRSVRCRYRSSLLHGLSYNIIVVRCRMCRGERKFCSGLCITGISYRNTCYRRLNNDGKGLFLLHTLATVGRLRICLNRIGRGVPTFGTDSELLSRNYSLFCPSFLYRLALQHAVEHFRRIRVVVTNLKRCGRITLRINVAQCQCRLDINRHIYRGFHAMAVVPGVCRGIQLVRTIRQSAHSGDRQRSRCTRRVDRTALNLHITAVLQRVREAVGIRRGVCHLQIIVVSLADSVRSSQTHRRLDIYGQIHHMNRVRIREHFRYQRIPDLKRAVLVSLEHIGARTIHIINCNVGCQVLTTHSMPCSGGVTDPSQSFLLADSPVLRRHKYIRHNLQLQVEDRVAVMTRCINQRVKNNLRVIGTRPFVVRIGSVLAHRYRTYTQFTLACQTKRRIGTLVPYILQLVRSHLGFQSIIVHRVYIQRNMNCISVFDMCDRRFAIHIEPYIVRCIRLADCCAVHV